MKRILAMITIFISILFFYFYSTSTAYEVLKKQKIVACEFDCNSDNEILVFDKKYLDEIIDGLNLEIYLMKEISDRIVIEGYTNKLNDFVVVNNMKVNIQMSIDEEKITLGYPLIDASF